MSFVGSLTEGNWSSKLHKCQGVPWSFDDDLNSFCQITCQWCNNNNINTCTCICAIHLILRTCTCTCTCLCYTDNIFSMQYFTFMKHICACQSSHIGSRSCRQSLVESPSIRCRWAFACCSQISWSPPDSTLHVEISSPRQSCMYSIMSTMSACTASFFIKTSTKNTSDFRAMLFIFL